MLLLQAGERAQQQQGRTLPRAHRVARWHRLVRVWEQNHEHRCARHGQRAIRARQDREPLEDRFGVETPSQDALLWLLNKILCLSDRAVLSNRVHMPSSALTPMTLHPSRELECVRELVCTDAACRAKQTGNVLSPSQRTWNGVTADRPEPQTPLAVRLDSRTLPTRRHQPPRTLFAFPRSSWTCASC